MRNNMIRVINVVVSASLIVYLIYAVDWGHSFEELRQTRPLLVVAALGFFLLNIGTSAWKWQISLKIHGLTWRARELGRIVLIGQFVSSFLPTAIGGDIYRVYRTLPSGKHKSRAVSALLLDRLVGVLALLFVGALGALAVYLRTRDPAIGLLALTLAAPPLFAAPFPYLLTRPGLKPLSRKLARIHKLEPLLANARTIFSDQQGLTRLIGASILYHLIAAAGIALLFDAADTHGVLAKSAVVSAIYSMSALIPFSINGLGIMEGSFAFTAQQLGISFSHAVVVALTLRLIAVLISLCGGIVFLFDNGHRADLSVAAETVEQLPD